MRTKTIIALPVATLTFALVCVSTFVLSSSTPAQTIKQQTMGITADELNGCEVKFPHPADFKACVARLEAEHSSAGSVGIEGGAATGGARVGTGSTSGGTSGGETAGTGSTSGGTSGTSGGETANPGDSGSGGTSGTSGGTSGGETAGSGSTGN